MLSPEINLLFVPLCPFDKPYIWVNEAKFLRKFRRVKFSEPARALRILRWIFKPIERRIYPFH